MCVNKTPVVAWQVLNYRRNKDACLKNVAIIDFRFLTIVEFCARVKISNTRTHVICAAYIDKKSCVSVSLEKF
jgi:hypothetical protein